MGSNSFETHEGSHVTGTVAMAIDETGLARPVDKYTEIGVVEVSNMPFTLEQFCRALAAHVVTARGGNSADMESTAAAIIDFAHNAPRKSVKA